MSAGWLWEKFVQLASFEWMLTSSSPNGGDVILARSLGVATLLTAFTILLRNLIDPHTGHRFSSDALRSQIIEIAPWFAAAMGAVYAALYARFASQWAYLAALYNQIKQAELEMTYAAQNVQGAKDNLAEWKAGYIEDAQVLHLHAKKNVAAIIFHWSKDPAIQKAFEDASAGGAVRWAHLQADVAAAYRRAVQEHAG
jgi:hypothetical protein